MPPPSRGRPTRRTSRSAYRIRMSNLVAPVCPNCGAALPPRGASAVYQCMYCQRTFETDAPTEQHAPPLAERTTSDEFPRLVAEAERQIVEVERSHVLTRAKAVELGGTAMLLQQAASKKIEQRFATTRKAIAERDEATLRDCVERLAALQNLDAGFTRR